MILRKFIILVSDACLQSLGIAFLGINDSVMFLLEPLHNMPPLRGILGSNF